MNFFHFSQSFFFLIILFAANVGDAFQVKGRASFASSKAWKAWFLDGCNLVLVDDDGLGWSFLSIKKFFASNGVRPLGIVEGKYFSFGDDSCTLSSFEGEDMWDESKHQL